MSMTPSRHMSRPTTPLRRRSESRLTEALQGQHYALDATRLPLDTVLSPALEELNDGLADLEQNLQHLQLMHESVTSFNESFAAFLYGIEMNAWCVEFPEAPTSESFRRDRSEQTTPAAAAAGTAIPGQQTAAEPMEMDHEYTGAQDEPEYDEYEAQPQTQPAVPKSRLKPPAHGRASTAQSRIPSYTGSSRIPMKTTTRQASTAKSTKPKPPTTTPWR